MSEKCAECGAETIRGRIYRCYKHPDLRFCTYGCSFEHNERDWQARKARA